VVRTGMASRWFVGLLVVLTIMISTIYLATAFTAANGRAVAPLDDAYITFQYARQMARGYPYQYNDGDPPTTGMTSPLFGVILAGFYLLGFTGERLVGLALGMGVVWLGATGWFTYRLAQRLLGDRRDPDGWAMAAATFVLLSGPIEWGCFNGMETGLFTVVTLAALVAFLDGRVGQSGLWLGLAGLVRPEGLILACLIWVVALVNNLASHRQVRWRRMLPLSVAIAVGLMPLVVNWALTGTAAAAGVQTKSWLYNVPFRPRAIARSVLTSCGTILLKHFLGWDGGPNWFVVPGLFLGALMGWGALMIQRRWKALVLTLSWLFLGVASTATLITASWHYGRYQVPFLPLVSALTVGGLAFLCGATKGRWRYLIVASVVLLTTASARSGVQAIKVYRRSVKTVAGQQLAVASWLRRTLPADARVGVHDAGSLRYLGERSTYDLVGLTTPGAAIAWRNGPGSVFELMERSPMRPDYFAIYPDVFFIPYLAATDLFSEEMFWVEVPDYTVASAGPVQGVWRADWRLAGSGDRFYQPDILSRTIGLELVDKLDVADLDDEAAHHVTWWEKDYRPGFPTEVWQLIYRTPPHREVLDGGRLVTGGIAFEVETRPGDPLWIVARLHALERGVVRVEVNGVDVGSWAYPPMPGQWLETLFRVPAEQILSTRAHIVLSLQGNGLVSPRYPPYYFWFLQGEPRTPQPQIGQGVEATFGDRLHLLGFSLSGQVWQPGDVVPVTLYWQASAATDGEAKVFLHLYDMEGNLITQSDGWPYYDTRPPYTWWPGEVVVDPRQLPLPEQVSPGRYIIAAGLYEPDGPRLPAYVGTVRQPEDRVMLGTIEVSR